VLGSPVLAQLRVVVERLGPEARRGSEVFRLVGPLGERQTLGVVSGLLPLRDLGQALVDCDLASVGGVELGDLAPGLFDPCLVSGRRGRLHEDLKMCVHAFPEARVSGVRPQRLALPDQRLEEQITSLGEMPGVELELPLVVERRAKLTGKIR